MSQKGIKIGFWISTGLSALAMAGIAFMHISHQPPVIQGITSLGYPEYMLTILGVAEAAAAIVFVIPGVFRLKEWAYAGAFIKYTGAAWSHLVFGQPPVPILVLALILGVSYYFYLKLSRYSELNLASGTSVKAAA